jgi:hypothetical protein
VKKVIVSYYNKDKSISHTSDSFWSQTNLHCLNCGEVGLYAESVGDYYEGETHICLKCGYYFNLPQKPSDGKEDVQREQVLQQLTKE